jgi:hypothetical protein
VTVLALSLGRARPAGNPLPAAAVR